MNSIQVKRINKRSAELAKEACREVELETGNIEKGIMVVNQEIFVQN